METTLPLPFLPSVDLSKRASEATGGLTRAQLSCLGCVYFSATTKDVDNLLQFLQKHVSTETYVNATRVKSNDDIVSILDAGARKVFVTPAQSQSLTSYGDRVISTFEDGINGAYPNGTLVHFPGKKLVELQDLLDPLLKNNISPIFVTSDVEDVKDFASNAAKFPAIIPVFPATSLTIGATVPGKVSVSEIIGHSWTSDRSDKLIPTVVTDERGIALGLVYSSEESLAESLKTGTGVYQSRKRGLWYKGATSGDTQELIRISLDCDQDCLKFVVRQKGRGK